MSLFSSKSILLIWCETETLRTEPDPSVSPPEDKQTKSLIVVFYSSKWTTVFMGEI